MTEIEQAMASLKHLVECRCDEAYTGRGRHDPNSACDYAEEVKIVADHVAAIEDKLAAIDGLMVRRIKHHQEMKDLKGSSTAQKREHYKLHVLSETLGEIRKVTRGESHDV